MRPRAVRLLAAGLCLLTMAFLGSCSSSSPTVASTARIAVPTFHNDCRAVSSTATVLPVKVVAERNLAWTFVGVCINGLGPYSFVVDTGAEVSLLDSTVAKQVAFAHQTKTFTQDSFGCRVSSSFAEMTSWSIGPRSVRPEPMLVGTLANPEAPGLAGLIGSDVLSSFGAVRFDFTHQTLTVQAAQHIPTADVAASDRKPTTPASLTRGTTHSVPMNVKVLDTDKVPGLDGAELAEVRPTVPVSVGSRTYAFVVDTGARGTVVGPPIATANKLTELAPPQYTYAGLGCRVKVTTDQLNTWRLTGTALAAQPVGVNTLSATVPGLLGAGTLQYFSPVVVDYRDGELLLGAFAPPPAAPSVATTPGGSPSSGS